MPDSPSEVRTAFIRVVDDAGASFGQVFGPVATKSGEGWTVAEASLHGLLGALRDGRKLAVSLTDKAGKSVHFDCVPVVESNIVTLKAG